MIARRGPPPMSTDPAILVVRLSAIGDIVMASPLIHALRQRYPRSHIAWLVQPESAALLHDHPELDEVIVWPRSQWRELWAQKRLLSLLREIRKFRATLHRRDFALAIDLQGLLKSGILVWLSGAKRRIGLGSREGSQGLMTEVLPRAGEAELIGSEYRFLAKRLQLPDEPFQMQVGIGALAQAQAGQLRRSIPAGSSYAVICPFTTRPQKHWFVEHWRELVPRLRSDCGMEVVMLGGPGDVQAARSIAMASDVIDLVGQTQLQAAAALIRDSGLVIGVDTGLTHIGIAFDRPTICLFGSTRPYLRSGSIRTRVIYHALECSPCRRNPTCQGRFTCLRQITPDEVMTAVRGLLGGSRVESK
jgi:heptosyltransferase-1